MIGSKKKSGEYNRKIKMNDSVVEVAEKKEKILRGNTIVNNNSFFELLFFAGVESYRECGECCGFMCKNCWRGVLVIYAYNDKEFYKYLEESSTTHIEDVLLGVDLYGEYKKRRNTKNKN